MDLQKINVLYNALMDSDWFLTIFQAFFNFNSLK